MTERNLSTRTKETANNNDNWLLEAIAETKTWVNCLTELKPQNNALNCMGNHE